MMLYLVVRKIIQFYNDEIKWREFNEFIGLMLLNLRIMDIRSSGNANDY